MSSNIYYYNYEEDRHDKIQSIDLSKYSKREQQFLGHIERFKHVNTYIIKSNYIFIKLADIRAIITKDDVIFVFPVNHCFTEINRKILEQYHPNFILSVLELIIEYIHQNVSALINNFTFSEQSIHKKQVDIKILEEQYSDIVDVLMYFLENENDLNEIADIIFFGTRNNDDDKSKQSLVCDIENILENGCNMLRDIVKEFKRLDNILENKKVEMEINLAQMRNKIAIFSLHINFLSMIFAFGGFAVGIFGMNLKNEMEYKPFGLYYYLTPLIIFLTFCSIQYHTFYKKSLIIQMSNQILT